MSQSTAIQKADKDRILEQVITKGDLADISPADRVSYYNAVCQSLGLNPLTKPFEFVKLTENGKEVIKLYARKDATEQLRKINGVSIWKIENVVEDGCLIVTAYARTPDGREDVDEGVVYIKGKVGDNLANLQMKAITKAKRRVTLSICGLGFLDETEVDSIPNAQPIEHPEQEVVMTESEQEALALSHKASGLDQWACGRGLAMPLINICKSLEAAGVDEDTWRTWLPSGIQSRKELTEDQAREVFDDFTARLKLIHTCMELGAKGVDKETMRMALPGGAKSVFSLTSSQTQEALKKFTHWLNTYNQVVEGGMNNG